MVANPIGEAGSLLLRVKELEEQHLAFRNSLICAFNQLLDLKDISTGVHSTRLAEWAIRVARKLNIPEEHLYQVEVAALIHDIGKMGVPDAILKEQGPLTAEERADQSPPRIQVVNSAPVSRNRRRELVCTAHHHENVDGTAYPAGLKGDDIPIVSRIVRVIDAYDAMVTNRCYRKGLPHAEASVDCSKVPAAKSTSRSCRRSF